MVKTLRKETFEGANASDWTDVSEGNTTSISFSTVSVSSLSSTTSGLELSVPSSSGIDSNNFSDMAFAGTTVDFSSLSSTDTIILGVDFVNAVTDFDNRQVPAFGFSESTLGDFQSGNFVYMAANMESTFTDPRIRTLDENSGSFNTTSISDWGSTKPYRLEIVVDGGNSEYYARIIDMENSIVVAKTPKYSTSIDPSQISTCYISIASNNGEGITSMTYSNLSLEAVSTQIDLDSPSDGFTVSSSNSSVDLQYTIDTSVSGTANVYIAKTTGASPGTNNRTLVNSRSISSGTNQSYTETYTLNEPGDYNWFVEFEEN